MPAQALQISRTMWPLHFGEESENRLGDWQCQAEAAERWIHTTQMSQSPGTAGKGGTDGV